MTRYVNWKDKKTCTLFADGAGAVVLGASDKPGFLGAKLLADGEYHDALGIYTGGTNRPATAETLALTDGKPAVQFVRKFPATFNTERWPMLLEHAAQARGADAGRREAVRLHAAQPAHHRGHHEGAQPAHGQGALHDGQVGLHGLAPASR